jgi:hypothetical protein
MVVQNLNNKTENKKSLANIVVQNLNTKTEN